MSDESRPGASRSGEVETSTALAPSQSKAIAEPEVLPDLNGSGRAPAVDIGRLMETALSRITDPNFVGAVLDQVVRASREADRHELEMFKLRAAANIEAKKSDPDYIDKRSNNQSRRYLRYSLPILAFGALIAMVALALCNVPGWAILALAPVPIFGAVIAGGLGAGNDAPSAKEIGEFADKVLNSKPNRKISSPESAQPMALPISVGSSRAARRRRKGLRK